MILSKRQAGPLAIYIAVSALVLAASYFFQNSASKRNVRSFLELWLESEYFSIQEGGLLQSAAKLERGLAGESGVSGVLIGDIDAEGRELLSFGDVGVIPNAVWAGLGNQIQIFSCGFLRPCAAVMLPSPSGRLGIVLSKRSNEYIAQLILSSLGMLLLSGAGMVIIPLSATENVFHKL